MLTGQSFCQTLITRMVDPMLLGMVWDSPIWYVCICIQLLEVINCTLSVVIFLILAGKSCHRSFLVPLMDQSCRYGSIHNEDTKLDPFEISDKCNIHSYPNRHHWSFAFAHASMSSKCILFSIWSLLQLNYFVVWPSEAECIVGEMIDWLKVCDPALINVILTMTFGKNQTVDPQLQDQLIAWMEDANKKFEEAIATQKQRDIDEELQQSAEWANVI